MDRFWSEAVVVPELPEREVQAQPHTLIAPAPEGYVVFTLQHGAKPSDEEIEAAVEEVLADLEDAEE